MITSTPRQRSLIATALASLLLAGAAAQTGIAATPANSDHGVTEDEIRIGWIGARTGPVAPVNDPIVAGLTACFDQVNAAGGVHGRSIRLIPKDDGATAAKTLPAWRELVEDDKVLLVTGPEAAGTQAAIVAEVAEGDVVIVGEAFSNELTQNQPNIFNLAPDYPEMMDVIWEYMKENLDVPLEEVRIATLSLDTPSHILWRDLLQERVESDGGSFVEHIVFPTDATDLSAEAQRLVSADVDYVAVLVTVGQAKSLFSAFDRIGVTVPMVGSPGTGTGATWEGSEDSPNARAYAAFHFATPAVAAEGHDEFRAAAEAAGYEGDAWFTLGWVRCLVIAQALDAAGPDVDRPSFRETMETLGVVDTGGLSGPIEFDGDPRHQGLQVGRLYGYDFERGQIIPVSDYPEG